MSLTLNAMVHTNKGGFTGKLEPIAMVEFQVDMELYGALLERVHHLHKKTTGMKHLTVPVDCDGFATACFTQAVRTCRPDEDPRTDPVFKKEPPEFEFEGVTLIPCGNFGNTLNIIPQTWADLYYLVWLERRGVKEKKAALTAAKSLFAKMTGSEFLGCGDPDCDVCGKAKEEGDEPGRH